MIVDSEELPAHFKREMGFSRREFLANLKIALNGRPYHCDDDRAIEIPIDAGRVLIALGDEKERRIASLVLPFLEVEFVFENLDAEQRRSFYAAFQRSFQRGGG